jgi:hypothetical protein
MSCKTENTTIGEHEYSVTQWPADKALTMKFRLGKTLGPFFGKIATGVKKEKGEFDIDKAVLSDAISQIFKDSTPEDLTKLLKDSIVGSAIDGTKITETTFNQYFSGDSLGDVYKVFFFVIKVNYSGNFIPALAVETLVAKAKKLMQENSQI